MSQDTRKRRATDKPYRQLSPEPWGAKLARARKAAGYTDTRRLDGCKRHLGFGRGPVGALERLDKVPADPTLRERAFKLIVFYGFDPTDFGLGPEDAPTVIDLRALRDLGISSTKWYAASEGVERRVCERRRATADALILAAA